ncbi:hypothetical protein ACHAL6_00405 [Proteiniclasticum sp. C24MP]|uniref:hypothetical protein n=1 Tax=Proteiniclasticum sp. C24MP TaxID=3374101 RepID=UPI003753F861
MNAFKEGERVKSNVFGYYFGEEGTVKGKAQIQYDNHRKYLIELDNGKVIALKEYQISRV